jgi:hypothetical protein
LDRTNEPGADGPRASSRLGTIRLRRIGRPLRRPLRFFSRHRILGALLLVVLVLVGGAAYDLIRIARDLDGGRRAISGLAIDDLDAGLVPTIEGAAGRLHRADHVARTSPFLRALRVVPGVGTQIGALRDLTGVGDHFGATGVRSAEAIDQVLQQAGGDPSKRVVLLDTVLEQLDVVEQDIADVHVGADGFLVKPLGDARQKLVDELEEAPERLGQARFYVQGLRRLLQGPSRYIVLAGNNAEMRGGAGMPLQGGVVTIANGDITFGDFASLAYLKFDPPTVRYPLAWKDTYYRWSFGRSYPETSVSPSFPVTAPMYQAMAGALGAGEVDGVIEVDAVALKNLLHVIGPVELDGFTYDEGNVEQQVLNENYLKFDTLDERGERQEVQAALAKAIFEAFKARDIPVAQLAIAMRDAAKGRHLLAQSDDPAVQELWESVGADGRLNELGLMVTVQNIGANKLDWFVQPSVTLSVLPSSGGTWRARLTVAVENPVPPKDQDSPYVDGSYDGPTQGAHRSFVAVYLPKAAYNIRSVDQPYSEAGLDPPLHMIGTRITIPLGETVRSSFEFSLPEEMVGAFILPSARVRPVQYEVNGTKVDDAVVTPVFWSQPPGSETEDTPGAAAVAGVLALAGALAVVGGLRTKMRYTRMRPIRAVPDLALQAPTLGVVLFVAAAGVLVAGWLISGFGR